MDEAMTDDVKLSEQDIARDATETAQKIIDAFEDEDWPEIVDHMADLLGWTRLEAMFLWFTRQTINTGHQTMHHYRVMAENYEEMARTQKEWMDRIGPIVEKMEGELDEGEDWKKSDDDEDWKP